jgi:hypothetical protein
MNNLLSSSIYALKLIMINNEEKSYNHNLETIIMCVRNACMYGSFPTLPFVQGTMLTIQEKLHILYAM